MSDPRAEFSAGYAASLAAVLRALPHDRVGEAIALLETALADDRQVFIVGNGGSAATASHMANDLMKTVTKGGGRGFRAIALTDNVPLLTAIGNDLAYSEVFSWQLRRLARPGDVLVAITGSGNSPNILRALEEARNMGVRTIGLLGMGGGKCAPLVDVEVTVASDDYGLIEDAHMALNHLVTAYFIARGKGP